MSSVPSVEKRYAEKIKICENIDPYSINIEDELLFDNLPKVQLSDLWNYLILSKSAYTQDQLKAYKSLDSHRFFESGFVRKLVAKRIAHNKSIVLGLVDHSQSINLPPLKPWVVCNLNGAILAAHCTCIAGLGEVCSHVGAVLYTVEAMVRSSQNQSKTDVLCQWNHPSTTSRIDRFVPLADMRFQKTERIGHNLKFQPEFTTDEIYEWVKENKENCSISPLSLITPGLNLEYNNTASRESKENITHSNSNLFNTTDTDHLIRQSLLNIFYNREYKNMNLEELLTVSKSIKVKLSAEDIELIEKVTRDQSESWLWEKLRVGRITGSSFKLVCRTSLKKPAKSTIMKICYPEKTRFFSNETDYGKKLESVARKAFIEGMQKTHKNFSCVQTGLIIDDLCNFFGVSPDGICSCDCCGKYLLEIKCPFCLSFQNSTVENLINMKDPYILFENGRYILNSKHSYFYQAQIQMAVCRLQVCYFYVFSTNVELCFKVEYNPLFWQENSLKALQFAKVVIVPELMNSHYTKTYA